MAIDDKLQELLKNKKVIIPAAIIGGVLGLYVLSKQSGGSGGIGLPENPGVPQPPDAGAGGGSGDSGAISARIDEIAASQTGFQQSITAALQALSDSLGSAINQVRGENQSALQSVIDQVNSQLAAGQSGGASIPDFAGFQSQLLSALGNNSAEPISIPATGNILKNQISSALRRGTNSGSLYDQALHSRAPSTFGRSVSSAAHTSPQTAVTRLISTIKKPSPTTYRPTFTPGGSIGRLVKPSPALRGFGAGTGINQVFASGFNKLSGVGTRPAYGSSRVIRSYTPAPFRTIAPAGFRRTSVLKR